MFKFYFINREIIRSKTIPISLVALCRPLHRLDLMLEDVYKIPNIHKALKRGMEISNFVYVHLQLLNMMRRFTNKKELIIFCNYLHHIIKYTSSKEQLKEDVYFWWMEE